MGGVQQWKAVNECIISMSKKATIQPHTCFECALAHLMRSAPHNPVVAECTITHERNVASTLIPCRHFKQRVGEAEINPMKPCCI